MWSGDRAAARSMYQLFQYRSALDPGAAQLPDHLIPHLFSAALRHVHESVADSLWDMPGSMRDRVPPLGAAGPQAAGNSLLFYVHIYRGDGSRFVVPFVRHGNLLQPAIERSARHHSKMRFADLTTECSLGVLFWT